MTTLVIMTKRVWKKLKFQRWKNWEFTRLIWLTEMRQNDINKMVSVTTADSVKDDSNLDESSLIIPTCSISLNPHAVRRSSVLIRLQSISHQPTNVLQPLKRKRDVSPVEIFRSISVKFGDESINIKTANFKIFFWWQATQKPVYCFVIVHEAPKVIASTSVQLMENNTIMLIFHLYNRLWIFY